MIRITEEELKKILKFHKMWLIGKEDGVRANLSGANLSYADLSYADLRNADLSGANLSYANLRNADLRDADLRDIQYDIFTSFFALQCPEEGAFIGYKKCGKYIIKLQITDSAKRSSATSRKCRASEVLVLDIQNIDGTPSGLTEYLHKDNYTDKGTLYKVGGITKPDSFDEDRWNECSNGIHFFITRNEAVYY